MPKFLIGKKVGHFTLIRRVKPKRTVTSANLKTRWKVRCCCGEESIVPEYYMRRANPKTHCGCLNKTAKTIYNQEYRIWLMMHQRCYNEDHMAYKHYGGRGICIHPDWNRYVEGGGADKPAKDFDKAFEAFLEHIGPRPSKLYSVDRIEVNGNYEPGNVKWATAKEQRANQRPRGSST